MANVTLSQSVKTPTPSPSIDMPPNHRPILPNTLAMWIQRPTSPSSENLREREVRYYPFGSPTHGTGIVPLLHQPSPRDRRRIEYSRSPSTLSSLIAKQVKFRTKCWRIAWLDGTPKLVSIEKIDGQNITVKVMEPSLPFDLWHQTKALKSELYPLDFPPSETLKGLIKNLKASRILRTDAVEAALKAVDRKHFCSETPYYDQAIDIGKKHHGVCISSPHMHTWAAELLLPYLEKAQRCLDVGSGSGYFTALMAHLAPEAQVYGIEVHGYLSNESAETLKEHYPELWDRITLSVGIGEEGNSSVGPFDAIHVGYMLQEPPQALIDQLLPGGRLIFPLWDGNKSSFDNRCQSGMYTCVDKDEYGKTTTTPLFGCSFVPSLADTKASG